MKKRLKQMLVCTLILTGLLCLCAIGMAEEEGLQCDVLPFHIQGNPLDLTLHKYTGKHADDVTGYEVVVYHPISWNRIWKTNAEFTDEVYTVTINEDELPDVGVLTLGVYAVKDDEPGKPPVRIAAWDTCIPVFEEVPDEPKLVMYSDTVGINETFEAAVYAPGAATIIISAGEETWTNGGERGYIQAWYTKSGERQVSAIIGYPDGTSKTIDPVNFTVSDTDPPSSLGAMDTGFPARLEEDDLSVTINRASNAPDAPEEPIPVEMPNVWYTLQILDLTENNLEDGCRIVFEKKFARDEDKPRGLNELGESQSVSLSNVEFISGHTYRMQVVATCAGYPDLVEYQDYVAAGADPVIKVEFADSDDLLKTVAPGENIRFRITLQGEEIPDNIFISNEWGGYEDLHNWGDWWKDDIEEKGWTEVNWSYESGDWTFHVVAVNGEPGDEWEDLQKSVSNVLYIHVNDADRMPVPTITFPEGRSVRRGDFLQIELTDLDEKVQGGGVHAGQGDEWFWDVQGWMTGDGKIQFPTAQLEPGIYNLAVDVSGEGYNTGTAYSTFMVVEREEENDVFISTDAAVVEDGKYQAWINQRIVFSGFAEGADHFEIYNGEELLAENLEGNSFVWDRQWDETCDLDIYAIAYDADDHIIGESNHLAISVEAKGTLQEPVITTESYLPIDGFTFSVFGLVESGVVDGESVAVPVDWWDGGVYDETANQNVFQTNADEVYSSGWASLDANNEWTFTIPEDQLTVNHVYKISFGINAEGYEGAYTEVRVPVVGATKDDTLTLEFHGGEPENIWSGEQVYFRVSAPDGTKAVALFTGDGWDYQDKEDDDTSTEFIFSRSYGSGDYTLFAMASEDKCGEGEAWEDLETAWSISEPLSLTVKAGGYLDQPRILNMSDMSEEEGIQVPRGENLTVEVGIVADAEWYGLQVKDKDDRDVFESSLEAPTDAQSITFTVPTLWLTEGNSYWVQVNVNRKHYDGNRTEWRENWFEVTEADEFEDDILIQTDKTHGKVSESFTVTAQVKQTEGLTGFEVWYGGEPWDSEYDIETDLGQGCLIARLEMMEGENEVYVVAKYGDGDNLSEIESDRKTISTDVPQTMTLGFEGLQAVYTLPEMPEGIEFTVRGLETAQNCESNRWWTVDFGVNKEDGEGYHFDPNNSPATDRFTIPASMLENGNVISGQAHAHAYGYRDADAEFSMIVISGQEEDGIQLLVNGVENPDSILSNEEFTVTIKNLPEGITGLRIYTGGGDWDYGHDINCLQEDGNNTFRFEQQWRWDSGDYTLIAQYTTDDNDVQPHEKEWDGTCSNPVSLKVVAENGDVTTGNVTINPASVSRGKLLEVSFEQGKNVESWSVDIRNEDGWNCINTINPRIYGTVKIPTATLSPGNYEVVVRYNGLPGYDSKEKKRKFTVTEAEITDMILTVTPDSGPVHERVVGAAYCPDADYYVVSFSNEEEPWNPEFRDNGYEFEFELMSHIESVTVKAYKQVNPDDSAQDELLDSETVNLQVDCAGELPIRLESPSLLNASVDNTITVSGLDAADLYWEVVVFHQEGYGEESHPADDLVWNSESGDDYTGSFTIEANRLVPNQEYGIYVNADAYGYDRGWAQAKFQTVNASDGEIILTVNGQDGTIGDGFYSYENLTIEVSAPGAKKIRFFNPDMNHWEEADTDNGEAVFNVGFGSGEYTLTATASYSDEEVIWEGISNEVSFSVVSKTEVGAPELEFNDGPNPSVARGVSIPVTIIAGQNATKHQIHIFDENNGDRGWFEYYEAAGNNVNVNIMTGRLEPGRYYVGVGSTAGQSDWNWSDKQYWFTVADGDSNPGMEVNQYEAVLGGDFFYSIYGYGPDDQLRLYVTMEDNDEWGSREQYDHEYNSFAGTWEGNFNDTWQEGTYLLKLQKLVENGVEPNWEDQGIQQEVTIAGMIGTLSAPPVNVSKLVMPGDSLSFSFDRVENAEWYGVTIYHNDENGWYQQDYSNNEDNLDVRPGRLWTIENDKINFEDGVTYHLEVSAWAKGYEGSCTDVEIVCGNLTGFTPFNMTLPKNLKQVDEEAFAGIDMTIVKINGTNTALDLSFLNEYQTRYVVAEPGTVTVPEGALFEIITPEQYQNMTR